MQPGTPLSIHTDSRQVVGPEICGQNVAVPLGFVLHHFANRHSSTAPRYVHQRRPDLSRDVQFSKTPYSHHRCRATLSNSAINAGRPAHVAQHSFIRAVFLSGSTWLSNHRFSFSWPTLSGRAMKEAMNTVPLQRPISA